MPCAVRLQVFPALPGHMRDAARSRAPSPSGGGWGILQQICCCALTFLVPLLPDVSSYGPRPIIHLSGEVAGNHGDVALSWPPE